MNFDDVVPFIFGTAFIAILGTMAWRFLKYGGFRGAMFGARITRTVGEVAGAGQSLMKTAIKVHALDGGPSKAVGLELVAKSIGSYQMMPFALSADEARRLVAHLQAALNVR